MNWNVWGILSLVLLVLGAVFYVVMGTTQGAWTDVGVYSFTAVLVGFGAFGLLASKHAGRRPRSFS